MGDQKSELLVDGEKSKRFRVYDSDIDDRPFRCLGSFDTVAEVLTFCRRLDVRYKINVAAREYLSLPEFKKQFGNEK
jgi:hypothetical protein